jgi:hypothetical protein
MIDIGYLELVKKLLSTELFFGDKNHIFAIFS